MGEKIEATAEQLAEFKRHGTLPCPNDPRHVVKVLQVKRNHKGKGTDEVYCPECHTSIWW